MPECAAQAPTAPETAGREQTLYYLLQRYSETDGWLEVSRHSQRAWVLHARESYLRDHPEVRPQALRILHLALVEGAW